MQPVSGRALIALVCMNFRVDRNDIATMTLMRLQSIKLSGWGMAAVSKFMLEVDSVMQEIDQDVLDRAMITAANKTLAKAANKSQPQ